MWPAASTVLLLSFIGASRSTLSTTSTSCICPGRQLVYECTVNVSDVQASVWRGSALDCSRGISLLHRQFIDTGYANGTCNGGAIFARITSHDGDRFTSQLTVNTSLDMNGKEIECAYDDGRDSFIVNTSTVRIRTAPFPPPTDVQLVDAQSRRISFNWTSVDAQCDSILYNITSINCGRCPTTTSNTTITCSDAHFSGQVCTLIVQAVVCGNIIGNLGIPTSVIMKVPRVSTIRSVPRYDHVTGSLLSIASTFDALDPVMVSNGYEIQVSSYSISYKDSRSSTGNICSPVTNIPITSCVESGVCNHTFEVLSSSFCNPLTNITVAVMTTNIFGSEEESDSQMIGSRNTFFDVDFTYEGDTLRITCIFFNTMTTNGKRSCTVMFRKDLRTCRNLSHSLKREQSTANTLRISIDLRLPIFSIKQNICLVIRASDVDKAVEIERRLTVASGCDKDYLSDGTVLPDGVYCGLPLLTAGIRNGLVCYSGTGIGAIATHHCFNCGSSTSTVRTCLPNGTWNGTVPHCRCSTSNTVYTAISMGVVIIAVVSALIIITILFIRLKIKIRQILQQMKQKEVIPIYDDINLAEIIDPKMNVAYETSSQPKRHHTISM